MFYFKDLSYQYLKSKTGRFNEPLQLQVFTVYWIYKGIKNKLRTLCIGVSRGGCQGVLTPPFSWTPFFICDNPPPTQPDLTVGLQY